MEISEEVLESLRDKWIEIGLTTGPSDLEKSIPVINQIYINADLDPPEFFFTAPSPLEAIRMSSALNSLGYETVKASKDPQKLVEDASKDLPIDASIMYDQMCFGNHEAASLSFYDFFINHTDVDNLEKIVPFIELASLCGWWIPLRSAAIICDRPEYIKMDERGLTHCEDGPAIRYANSDFDVYIWHGTRIPDEWIRDKSLTPEIALTHGNIEQRRAACEILGWDNILNELDTRIIDAHDDLEIGQLVEVDLPELGTEKFLKVRCGTGRTFAIPVPPEMNTALEANAWTYGVAANEYIPEIRT